MPPENAFSSVATGAGDDYVAGTDGFFYKFHAETVTWHAARDACAKEGASLAMEKTDATHTFLRTNYGDKNEMWIGVSDEVR